LPNTLRIKGVSETPEMRQLGHQGAGAKAARAILLSMESRKTLFRWLIGFAIGAVLYGIFLGF